MGAATKLVIVQQPSVSFQNEVALVRQPILQAQDDAGNVDATFTGAITAALSTPWAAFYVVPEPIATTHTVQAGTTATNINVSPPLSFPASLPQDYTNRGYMLVVRQSSTAATFQNDTVHGAAFITGNSGSGTVIIALGRLTGTLQAGDIVEIHSLTLFATQAMNAVAGVAAFSGLALSAGQRQTITFSSPGLAPATSIMTTPAGLFDPFALANGLYVELPRAIPGTTYPTISSSVTVGPSGRNYTSIQAALNALVATDTPLHREIICDDAALVQAADLTIPTRANGMGKIMIRPVTMPTANRRMLSGSAAQLALPKISAEAPSSSVFGLVQCNDGAHDVYFVGIWVDLPVPAAGDATDYLTAVNLEAVQTYNGSGTVSCTNGVATFSVNPSLVNPYFGPGSTITPSIDGHTYWVRAYDGNVTATLVYVGRNAPSFAASSFVTDNKSNPNAQPYNIGLDRCYVHGKPTLRLRKGVVLGGANQYVINSTVDEVHDFFADGSTVIGGVPHFGGSGADTNAVNGCYGPGPYLIDNNTLEAAGEVFICGGGDPPLTGLIPSDITFTRNLCIKPLAWQTINYPAKNNFELKNARRVLVEGNIFDGSWAQAQDGTGIVLASVNQGSSAPWSGIRDITFRNNFARNLTALATIQGTNILLSFPARRLVFYNNVGPNINSVDAAPDGINHILLFGGMVDTHVRHNTALEAAQPPGHPTSFCSIADGANASSNSFIDDNVVTCDKYGISTNTGTGLNGTAAIRAGLPDDPFSGNVLVQIDVAQGATYPAGSHTTTTVAAVGFVDASIESTWSTADPTTVCGALALAPAGIFSGTATDGTDPGADMNAVSAATRNTLTGDFSTPPPLTLRPSVL